MSSRADLTRCADVAPLLVFYACDEVSAEERERIDAHLASCPACGKQLSEELSMQATFTGASQSADQLDPSGSLLAQCRSELSELLDDLSAPPVREHWMPFGWVRQWMALRPVWSASFLVLLGLAVGTQASLWFSARDGGNNSSSGIGQAMNIMAAPRLTDEDLSKMSIAGVNFASASDAAPGTLQLQVRTEQPLVVVGNVDDADVRRVLTYVVANGERFDPGVRLDCLDGLRERSGDVEVRRALLAAARKDQNPAVRMKALELLRDAAGDDAVRETLLEALQHDANPGVRVEAVNLLVRSLEGEMLDVPDVPGVPQAPEAVPLPGDPSVGRVVRALEELQRHDPNRYVRLRSAAALRQIGPRDLQ
jgi:HEAT repeat protein/putative zinc finger protein